MSCANRASPPLERVGSRSRSGSSTGAPKVPRVAATLDSAGQARFAALKAWRGEVAKEHGLPAFVIFHDATLAQMAEQAPDSLQALGGISGVGAKKLDAYGREILKVLEGLSG